MVNVRSKRKRSTEQRDTRELMRKQVKGKHKARLEEPNFR